MRNRRFTGIIPITAFALVRTKDTINAFFGKEYEKKI